MESVDRHPFAGSDGSTRMWAAMMAVSFTCHLAFFAMMHFLPALRPEKKWARPPAVSVTMVSLPEAAPSSAPAKPAETPAPRVQPAPPTPAEPKKAEAPVPKTPPAPKIKQSLKKQTYRSSKVVDSAISRIQETVEQEAQHRPDPLKEALDRLREQVESTPQPAAERAGNEADASARPGLVGGSTEGIRKELELIDIYRMEIAWRVQKNWAFPDRLAGSSSEDLVVELAFTVMPNGEIRDVWFDKRSGNRYLDESAKRAVLKANPVGPFPKGITRSVIPVGLRFTPEGVK